MREKQVLIPIAAALWCLALSPVLLAAPPDAPSGLKAVPVYGTGEMRLTWDDNSSNEDEFQIERRDAGSFAPAGTAPAGTEVFVDGPVTPGVEYTYRVYARNSDGDSGFTNESANTLAVSWTLDNGNHEMLNGWQDGTPGNLWGFHEGIDVQDDGNGGQEVVACRGGIIHHKDEYFAGGHVAIEVREGTEVVYDAYLHIDITTMAKNEGEVVTPGEKIGEISTSAYDPGNRHVHHSKLSSWNPPDGPLSNGSNFRNPFRSFELDADRDPGGNLPGLEDLDGDAVTILYKRPAGTYFPGGVVHSDVDICAEVADNMGSNPRQNPRRIAYWIDGVPPASEDVRSAAVPYVLYDFDNWFGAASANINAVYDPDQETSYLVPWFFKRFHNMVTNTRGTDGTVGNLDDGQFWRTHARQGSGAEPNGSDAAVAREIQEARFPDGAYFVHLLMDDVVHASEAVQAVYVDNSRPYVRRVTVFSGLRIVYQSEWIWDTSLPQLVLTPAAFADAAPYPATRTQDLTIEVEFSEPMQSATIDALTPSSSGTTALPTPPTLASSQAGHARTVWRGTISHLDIDDGGAQDGIHEITINGQDLGGNDLLLIDDRAAVMGADHHNRYFTTGSLRGTAGTDTIHRFEIGDLAGTLQVTAIFVYQPGGTPDPTIVGLRALAVRTALNDYYQEVSYGAIDFVVAPVGWYELDHPLDWYEDETQARTFLVDLVQEAISAVESDVGIGSLGDYLLVVTDDLTAREEWSHNGAWPYAITAAPGWRLFVPGVIKIGSTDARITNTAGRMLGLIDLFAYDGVSEPKPFVGPWSPMYDKDAQVHVLGWEKWRAGWLDETGTATGNTLTRVERPDAASPIAGQPFTIKPLDTDGDDLKMVAIEVAEGLHYTAEYRRLQNLDATLPAGQDGVLLVKTSDFVNQGEGPAIVQESPVTAGDLDDATFTLDPARDEFEDVGTGITIAVTAMSSDEATITLDYALPPTTNDVYITPHDAYVDSVDIWIDAPDLEGHFEADPLNVLSADEKPVVGMENRLIARIRNDGQADAVDFNVRLEIREPWGAGGPWVEEQVDHVALLQGQATDPSAYYLMVVPWTPKAGVHACVRVNIFDIVNDVVPGNNGTQENINEFVTSPGSPYAPVTSHFEVGNPYDRAIPVFLRLDGIPEAWTYEFLPPRLTLPAGGVGAATVTIQPHDAAPLCSREKIRVSAYTPQVDTLKRLGALTLQVALKNPAGVAIEEIGADCRQRDPQGRPRSNDLDLDQVCAIHVQGCTDPALPNTQVAVVYTAPDGELGVRYVTTDASGCFVDTLTVGEPGLWETEVVVEETDCRAGARSPKREVEVDQPVGEANWWYFVHLGPNFPTGSFDDHYDPGWSLDLGAERRLTSRTWLMLLLGYHRFSGSSPSQSFRQAAVNLKWIYTVRSSGFAYVNAGVGRYRPRLGTDSTGFNLGTGYTWPLRPGLRLDLNADFHLLPDHSESRLETARFLDLQLGLSWRF
ncbi:MAG: hypothetical protein GY856_15595 [bacterium]|nr:hypothetical protein [bacterium]